MLSSARESPSGNPEFPGRRAANYPRPSRRQSPQSRKTPRPQETPHPPQKAASRANGAKSKGPETPEGKAVSALNSLRQGLLAKATVLPTESQNIFDALQEEFEDCYRPQNEPERACLEDMVSTFWRIRRIRSLEQIAIQSELGNLPDASRGEATLSAFRTLSKRGEIDLFLRYESKLHSIHSRAARELFALKRYKKENGALLADSRPPESCSNF